jgi:hypothetical protein
MKLGELGKKGAMRSHRARKDYGGPTDFLDSLIPGLGGLVAEYWTDKNPVEAFVAGLISGQLLAEERADLERDPE